MKDSFLSSEGRIGRGLFVLRLLLFVILTGATFGGTYQFFSEWKEGHHIPLGIFITLVVGLLCAFALLMQLIKRLHDAGKPPFLSILLLVPGVNLLLILYAAVVPSKG